MRIPNVEWSLTGQRVDLEVEGSRLVSMLAVDPIGQPSRYALPGFIDDHCHILPTGLDLRRPNLGGCLSREEALDRLRDAHAAMPEGWLYAVHYDQNRFADGTHLTRDELDSISSTRPILARHVNGHASVANSAALLAAGVKEDEPNPPGGEFGRDASGRLNGVLTEDAHERVTATVPNPTLDEMTDAILRAGEAMGAFGVVGACDMQTGRFDLDLELQAYAQAARQGALRSRLYLQWKTVFGPRAIDSARLKELGDDLKQAGSGIHGIKIFADGAIGSATAAIYGRYSGAEPNGAILSRHMRPAEHESREVSGQLIYSPEKLHEMVQIAHRAGYPVAIHAIGDYAVDLVLDAFEATGEPQRHRLEHAMLLSDSQIERIAQLGIYVSMQPEFLHRFGHAYRRQLGEERTSKLKRVRSLLDAGVPVSFSSDRPIVLGDPWIGIHTAENRPEGFDPAENCTRREALAAYCSVPVERLDKTWGGTVQLLDFDPLTSSPN